MIFKKNFLALEFIICISLIGGCATTKSTQKENNESATESEKKDENALKPYKKVITAEAKTDSGLFDVHKLNDKFYYEIPDSLLDREMLLVSRIAKTANNIGYGGEKLNSQVVRWQRRDNKVLLRHVTLENVANDTLPIYKAVRNSNFEPIISSFDIKSLGKDSTGVVIDITDLYSKDVPALGLQKSRRKEYKVRQLDGDRTFINYIHSYPKNIDARSLLTYQASNPPSSSSTGTISLVINHSMVLLPKKPMRAREVDNRVGYFSVQHTNYGTDAHKAEKEKYITRYKLVPKDKKAYLNGELVEPMHPIVYYIDPATPKKWRPYLKKGVEDWQKAFEAAGFKNAIIAKEPPTEAEDSTFSPEDVRYSVIRYFASNIRNAYGPNTHDPRTGQILGADIGWYHNVMSLLRDWYFVQTAAANPTARHAQMSDSTMGQLIRFVSSHELGHTLGLPHNWGASYAYPVDSLRSPTFTATHGTAPSIMDYARFNYVAQPSDSVKSFYPAIGEYDKWAIKWGYTWFPDSVSDKEKKKKLDRWIRKRAGDPTYFYGRQTGSKIDPRSQNEDLGNNAMKASQYGIKNLKYITNHLIEWTDRPEATYQDLDELYGQVVAQWRRYMGHVTRDIGGVYENNKTYDQQGVVYQPVPKEIQEKAMKFLNQYAFKTPEWMLDEDVLDRINQSTVVDNIRSAQSGVLSTLLDPQRIARLIEFRSRSDNPTYTSFEMMDQLRKGIWSELDTDSDISVYRRNLQRAYLEQMKDLMTKELPDIPSRFKDYYGWTDVDVSQSDIRPIVRNQLEILQKQVNRTESRVDNRATRVHLDDVDHRIERILNPNSEKG